MAPESALPPALQVRQLLRCARRGGLATRDSQTGAAYASLVGVATDADGAPLLLLSDLALHTANLSADPRVALLVEDSNVRDALAGGRVTISGTIARTGDPAARARFLARQPSAELYAGFADFNLYRLEPNGAHFIGGFGRIMALAANEVTVSTGNAGELLAAEIYWSDFLNRNHAPAIQRHAARCGRTPHPVGASAGAAWTIAGFDPEGAEISDGARVVYLKFRKSVQSAAELLEVFEGLAEE